MYRTLLRIIPIAVVSVLAASSAYAAVPASNLTVGSRGEEVSALQNILIDTSVGSAASALTAAGATGYFGPLTRAALAEYQSAHGIMPAQGYFGAKTRAYMSAHVSANTTTALFTGTVEAVNTGCFVDGICSVTVGGKEVIVTSGFRIPPLPAVGTLKGVDSIGDFEKHIGEQARVYAAVTTEGDADYTLYGNTDYYIQLLKQLPEEGKVTVRGTTECLPFKDTNGPHILLCALGLNGDDGRHYSLRYSDTSMSPALEGHIEVTGTFKKESHDTFLSDGVIEVTKVTKI